MIPERRKNDAFLADHITTLFATAFDRQVWDSVSSHPYFGVISVSRHLYPDPKSGTGRIVCSSMMLDFRKPQYVSQIPIADFWLTFTCQFLSGAWIAS